MKIIWGMGRSMKNFQGASPLLPHPRPRGFIPGPRGGNAPNPPAPASARFDHVALLPTLVQI